MARAVVIFEDVGRDMIAQRIAVERKVGEVVEVVGDAVGYGV